MKLPLTSSSTVCCIFASIVISLSGCGTNQFQQELQVEQAAIKLANETAQGDYQLISTSELKKLLDSGKSVVLIDAMPAAASFEKGHIAGAVNFEFPKEVMDSWDEKTLGGRKQADFEDMLGEDKDQTIVAYCGFVKCARSHNAAFFARQLGYKNVKRHPGGIHAWRGAGYPLTTE